MESDFQRNIHNYAFVPISGVNRPLQEVNADQVKLGLVPDAGYIALTRTVTSPADARQCGWYKAPA